jgi:hypothetical protein
VSAQNEDITIQNILTKYQFKDKYYTNILNNIYQEIGYQSIWFNKNDAINIINEIRIKIDNFSNEKRRCLSTWINV